MLPGEGATALASGNFGWPEPPAAPVPPAPPAAPVRSSWVPWLVPATLMVLLGGLGVGGPGLWGDEFATWGAARLPAGELARLVRVVDAVLAPYYAAMGAWVRLVGDSDIALRLPSVVAMAVAAGLVGALGSRLASPRAGVTSGVLFAGLPVVSRYAQEARPYAFVVLFTVLATWLLLRLIERPHLASLVWYALAVALLGLCNVVALLVLMAHAALVVNATKSPAASETRHPDSALQDRRLLSVRWLAAASAGVLPVVPLAIIGFSQKSQVGWVSSFQLSPLMYLVVLGGSLLGGAVICVLMVLSRPRRPTGWLLATWALLPPLALLALAPVVNLVLPRYLLFVLPAWILLAGIGLSQYPRRWTVIALAVIAVCALPQQWALRTGGGHEYQATRELADTITRYYQPGDGIVYGQGDADKGCCAWLARDLVAHYVPDDRRPRDLFLRQPQRVGGQMEAVEYDNPTIRIGNTPRIWVVRLGYRAEPLTGLGDGKEYPLRQRYYRSWVWHPLGFTAALYTRTGWTAFSEGIAPGR